MTPKPQFIENELFTELQNAGWEWLPDEDGWGSFHFTIILDEDLSGAAGICLDCFVESAELGTLYYSEFNIRDGQELSNGVPTNEGWPCLLKDLIKFAQPYLKRAELACAEVKID